MDERHKEESRKKLHKTEWNENAKESFMSGVDCKGLLKKKKKEEDWQYAITFECGVRRERKKEKYYNEA